MGPTVRNVRNKNSSSNGGSIIDDTEEANSESWPQIDTREENGVTIRVMQCAWPEGSEPDHVVKPRRKKKK